MGTADNPGWLFDCHLIEDIPAEGGEFVDSGGGFFWPAQGFNGGSNASIGFDGSLDSDGSKEGPIRKRARPESTSMPSSKACREKMRRDKLNDRFLELGAILEPGKPPKIDKAAILSDAVRMVNQLRSEAQKLKEANESLQETIKELKAEKNELRDEKQRLKVDKENLEQQVKAMAVPPPPSFIPHPPMMPAAPFPMPRPAGSAGNAAAGKLMMPMIGFSGFPMWQYMPPADVDTSQDAETCPPVA
ncbi:transcription factor ILR3-like [Wolffia australiana]